ncbi:MAG: sortase family protein [Berkelbacteria bacterium GW2011_GWA2_35_9]|uniref:Sortase family protein n=1 Tax=Berkelbacteria bacterium GW2011_GWA2_35_9 TaxID=1618333 RepID=A0A0G0D294_9BACT|nr:MAG: sortase family protein [Berkelbacteria bacterium GW2011_GWA2_35_9]
MRSIKFKRTFFKTKISKKGKVALFALSIILIIGLAYLVLQNKPTSQSSKKDLALIENIPQPLEKFEDFGLVIEKINQSAPIIPDIDILDQNVYLKAIEKGVALSKDSKNPKEFGNLFIFGHSDYLYTAPGDYKEVFKELDQLKKGDQFKIYFEKVPYTYEVFDSKVVDSKDFSVLDPTPKIEDDKTVTIMTCHPPGTTTNRWVVFAKQI